MVRSSGSHTSTSDTRSMDMTPDASEIETSRSHGKHLSGIEDTTGIEDLFETGLGVEIEIGEVGAHQVSFLDSDTVLPRQGAADPETGCDDLFPGLMDDPVGLLVARIEGDERMQVAIAGMEHIRHGQPVSVGDGVDGFHRLDEPGAWDHRVVQVVVGCELGNRPER